MPLAPDTSLGRYRLLERIGAGGMGEVWKAHDGNLDRVVAIKVLGGTSPDDSVSRERFRREAHVLSRLSHAGVATIFDFDAQDGIDFLVMEYVPGGTLDARLTAGPMPLDEVVRIGTAIAEALHAAHQHGFMYRDLKPANVVLSTSGEPKLLDFGLAALVGGARSSAALTQTGTIVGSLPYMAPEQLLGEADDARTDIYALGVVLFEMSTGRRPFVKERAEALMFEIFNNAPPSLRTLRSDAPDALDHLINDCLRKEPQRRPATAAEVAARLQRVLSPPTSAEREAGVRGSLRSIVVLPLRNVSNDAAQEYFADGMTEALISDLARIRALRVISRTSAMQYKGSTKNLPEIARELNVDAVLEGSALLLGTRVRVNVQLIDARADQTLWAERYDRQLEDVLGLQSELAETVAREIALQLTPGEASGLAHRAPVNPEAHLEFMKSRHAFYQASPQAVDLGLRHAARAIELDPTLAIAWCALADLHVIRASRGMAPPAQASAESMAASDRALALDPTLADAHASRGAVLCMTGDLHAGIVALRKAVALNPGLVNARSWLGRALYSLERHEEALVCKLSAASLDPLSMLVRTGVGDAYYFAREYDKSVFHYRMALELDPRFDGAHTDLARSLEALGRFDEARAEYEEGRRLAGGVAGPSFGLAHLEAASGNIAEARRILAELTAARETRVVSAWGIAALHASLGDVDDAYRWLELAEQERASGLMLLRVHPRLDAIRGDPRYAPMVARVGLADS